MLAFYCWVSVVEDVLCLAQPNVLIKEFDLRVSLLLIGMENDRFFLMFDTASKQFGYDILCSLEERGTFALILLLFYLFHGLLRFLLRCTLRLSTFVKAAWSIWRGYDCGIVRKGNIRKPPWSLVRFVLLLLNWLILDSWDYCISFGLVGKR